MKYQVRFTEQAHAEAEFTFNWIKQSSRSNAVEWFNGLVDAVESRCSMPERCGLAPESEFIGQEVRQLLYVKFRILFVIENKIVYVLHIRHGARKYMPKEDF